MHAERYLNDKLSEVDALKAENARLRNKLYGVRESDELLDRIVRDVSLVTGVPEFNILQPGRGTYPQSDARFLVCMILRCSHGMGVEEIGRLIERDHATVHHAVNRINQRRGHEKKLAEQIRALNEMGHEF